MVDDVPRDEKKRVCIGATGSATLASVHDKSRPYSFFDLKGDLETLFAFFDQSIAYDAANTAAYLHPDRSARAVISGTCVAQFGQIHPDIAATRKFRQEIFVAEIYLDALYRNQLRQPRYVAPSKFPAVDRDFSFVFAEGVTFEQVHLAVKALSIADLRGLTPVETFRGGNIPAGKYSLLLRAIFQSPARTLREEEVTQWSTQIMQSLEKLGGVLRT